MPDPRATDLPGAASAPAARCRWTTVTPRPTRRAPRPAHPTVATTLRRLLVTLFAGTLVVGLPTAVAAEDAPTGPAPASGRAAGSVTGPSPLAGRPVTTLATDVAAGVPSGGGTRDLSVLDDNGAWCWFQGERTIFTRDGRLLASSVADVAGTDGALRDAMVQVSNLDLRTGGVWTDDLRRGRVADDHNAAGLLELPSGRLLALSSEHSAEAAVHVSHQDPGGLGWAADQSVARPEGRGGDGVTYSNLFHLSAEGGTSGRVYDVLRSSGLTTWVMTSDDEGRTWTDRGQLFDVRRTYWRFASNGRDRIDLVVTDGHPSETDGVSLYAGYIQGGALHRSDGTRVTTLGTPVSPRLLTPVFRGTPGGPELQVGAWPADVELDAAGRPVVTFSTRVPGPSAVPGRSYRHEAWYGRWDGSRWRVRRIADAGSELYAGQPDYTGLSAVDPGDTSRVVLSTDVDPVSGVPLASAADGRVHHELFEGRTPDGGATWTWSPVTTDSVHDNLRPDIPRPRDGHAAVVWLRGSYRHFTRYDLDVVAVVDRAAPAPLPPARVRPGALHTGAGGQVPVSADLDGDGRDDLALHGPAAAPDVVVSPRWDDRWRSQAVRLDQRGAVPVPGDFDGDGHDDVLWYVPGTADDVLWYGGPSGHPTTVVRRVSGSYRPVSGDFDGDGADDVLWYGPGAAADHVWWGARDRTVRSTTTAVAGTDLRPVAGDLDGDGRDDVLWYGPGAVPDSVWWGRADRRLRDGSAPLRVAGTAYAPVTGDLDGDGFDDVLWYGAGDVADSVWWGGPDRRPGAVSERRIARGRYLPVTGDLDADGADEVVWYDPRTGRVNLWWGGRRGSTTG